MNPGFKFNALFRASDGVIDVRMFDPDNNADDPFFGFGADWRSAGTFDSREEAEAAASAEAARWEDLDIETPEFTVSARPCPVQGICIVDVFAGSSRVRLEISADGVKELDI